VSTASESYTAFAEKRRIASGDLTAVTLASKRVCDAGEPLTIMVFDDSTGRQVEIDLHGSFDDVAHRLSAASPEIESRPVEEEATTLPPRGPGRPRLGVVAREVTLLPRHWEWLATQSGGASVTLRKLVEQARRDNADADRLREARDAVYRFTMAMAGDEVGFEEATRSLYAGDRAAFDAMTATWPDDVRDHAREMANSAFPTAE